MRTQADDHSHRHCTTALALAGLSCEQPLRAHCGLPRTTADRREIGQPDSWHWRSAALAATRSINGVGGDRLQETDCRHTAFRSACSRPVTQGCWLLVGNVATISML